MKWLDVILRDWRYRMAEPHIAEGSRLLDVGGFDGSFLRRVAGRIAAGTCIDPAIEDGEEGKLRFVRSRVIDRLPFPDSSFDVVTMLAVFEHLSVHRESVVREVRRVLPTGGQAVLTVPSRAVDGILRVLIALRLADGMVVEEHDRFSSGDTVRFFEDAGFQLKRRSRFQLGLNNLFTFEKV